MEYIEPALIALAILAIGLALIGWRERRKAKRVRAFWIVVGPLGEMHDFSVANNEVDSWGRYCGIMRHNDALRHERYVAELLDEGYRCARVRVTEIGGK